MIRITPNIAIEEKEIREEFTRSSGPGGQNVNKVATAVQLRFDAGNSPSLPEPVKERLIKLAGKRMTSENILIIEARRYRSQEKNRKDARERLIKLIRKAAQQPKPRRKTSRPAAAKKRRLEEKRKRSEIKQTRKPVRRFEE